jgi:hypothetical protein
MPRARARIPLVLFPYSRGTTFVKKVEFSCIVSPNPFPKFFTVACTLWYYCLHLMILLSWVLNLFISIQRNVSNRVRKQSRKRERKEEERGRRERERERQGRNKIRENPQSYHCIEFWQSLKHFCKKSHRNLMPERMRNTWDYRQKDRPRLARKTCQFQT